MHISDDTGRIAMLETRTEGTDPSPASLQRYIYSNHLQSASLELDENAEIISYEEYHPYGTTSYQAMNASINAVAKRYRFCAAERDEENGLYMMGARFYICWLGRWASPDPINSENYNLQKGYGIEKNKERDFNELCASTYEYAYDNPINYTDETGEQPPVRPSLRATRPTRATNYNSSNSGGSSRGLFTTGRYQRPSMPKGPLTITRPGYRPSVRPYTPGELLSRRPTPPPPITPPQNYLTPYDRPTRPIVIPQKLSTGAQGKIFPVYNKPNPAPFVTMSGKTEHERNLGNRPPMERFVSDPRELTGFELAEIAKRIREGKATLNDNRVDYLLRMQNEMYELHPKHDKLDFQTKVKHASIAPDNHAEIWDSRKEKGVQDKKGNWWVAEGFGKKTVFHRFMDDDNGAFHWSGSTADGMDKRGLPVKGIDKQYVPKELKTRFKAN